MSPPDGPASRVEEGEVVEVFSGDSLEEAMAAAVASLGPDLAVRRARKVRAGVRGLLGRDRYEVLAVPGDGSPVRQPPVSDDPLEDAFASLLDAADAHESGRPVAPPPAAPARRLSRPSAPVPSASVLPPAVPPAPRSGSRRSLRPRRPVAEPEVLPADDAVRPRRAPERPPHPDPGVADHPAPPVAGPLPATFDEEPTPPVPEPATPSRRDDAPRRRAAAPRATTPSPAPRQAPARRSAAPRLRWSRTSLAAVGVPDAVLEHLPAAAPQDDLAWVVALTAAIEATVPPPAELGEENPVVVSGYGLEGAVAVLDAGCRGATPGTITHAGRTAPATATELALVLRHHVNDGG